MVFVQHYYGAEGAWREEHGVAGFHDCHLVSCRSERGKRSPGKEMPSPSSARRCISAAFQM